MKTSDSSNDIEFGGPATYRIVVLGSLDEEWSERLGGMKVTVTEHAPGRPRSTLRGYVRDQVELISVLDTLHELHLPILEVKKAHVEPSTTERLQP